MDGPIHFRFTKAPGVTLATLPGEFTLVMGRRIADMVRTNLGYGSKVLLIGLANEYIS